MATTMVPALHYTDTHAAIDFLCEAFGFRRHAVYEEDGTVAHAQLTLGDAMVMLGTHDPDRNAYQQLVSPVTDTNRPTMSLYIVLPDDDAVTTHCERARAAGAEIVMEPEDQDYGGRNYTCRDPEGNLWNFGSYDPWADEA